MNDLWIVKFVRKDGKPDEEYYYHSLAKAEYHRDLFLNDDSGLYALDKGKRLLSKMQYSIADERAKKEAPTEFHFKDNANIRYRMANLRSAVNKYFEFCKENND